MTTAARSFRLRCARSTVALSAELRSEKTTAEYSDLVNLSGSGCLLHTEQKLQVGEVVLLRFSLPGMKEVEATGRVARVVNLTSWRQRLGLTSFANLSAPRPSEEDHEFESGSRFFVGIAFDNLSDRDTELIVHHIFSHERRRRAS